jgi:ribose 1,5-bisphosphokinase PhnN
MRLAMIALAFIVMASAVAMAFNYAHQPSYAAPNQIKRNLDANGNQVVRNR